MPSVGQDETDPILKIDCKYIAELSPAGTGTIDCEHSSLTIDCEHSSITIDCEHSCILQERRTT